MDGGAILTTIISTVSPGGGVGGGAGVSAGAGVGVGAGGLDGAMPQAMTAGPGFNDTEASKGAAAQPIVVVTGSGGVRTRRLATSFGLALLIAGMVLIIIPKH
jgi:hypothetical protein